MKTEKSLLIVGAGSHGRMVEEIASDCGYLKIDFLDDNNPEAIGTIKDINRFIKQYPYAIVSLGNNTLRQELTEKLEKAGYTVPVLIHPSAFVSRTADIAKGTIVAPKAVVNTASKVGKGCILSIGVLVDHNAVIEDYTHLNTGVVIGAGVKINTYQKIQAGQIISGI